MNIIFKFAYLYRCEDAFEIVCVSVHDYNGSGKKAYTFLLHTDIACIPTFCRESLA